MHSAVQTYKSDFYLSDLQCNVSSSSNFNDIHIRDFIHEVRHDPSRPGYGSALQLHSDVNIPPVQGEELSDDIDVRPIPTLIRFFAADGQAGLFQTEVFVYVRRPFYINGDQDGYPQLVVTAFSVDCHPGCLTDLEAYSKPCLSAAPPSVSFQGTVIRVGDAMDRGPTLLHYDLKVVTYSSSARSQHHFTVRACLKNGKWAMAIHPLWQARAKLMPLPPHSLPEFRHLRGLWRAWISTVQGWWPLHHLRGPAAT